MFSRKYQEFTCPIDENMRLWFENAYLWLNGQFGNDHMLQKNILLPTPSCFPIKYDGSMSSVEETAKIIAGQMDIDFSKINIEIYDQGLTVINGDLGHAIYPEFDNSSEVKQSSGMYFGKNETGQYDIFIEKRNLSFPVNLAATISHEFAHIKLLGENRIEENDEILTDLTTVVYGLGIFNSISAFEEFKNNSAFGYNSIGYMKQQEWGYCLALYAFDRNIEKPDWLKYLTQNIQSDFNKSMNYINANRDKIFNGEPPGSS
ncbi:MAG: hypothetical protein QM791_06660 [Ferruginibacter sp.]